MKVSRIILRRKGGASKACIHHAPAFQRAREQHIVAKPAGADCVPAAG